MSFALLLNDIRGIARASSRTVGEYGLWVTRLSAEDKLSSVLKLAEGISMLISVLTVQMDTGKVFFSDMEE